MSVPVSGLQEAVEKAQQAIWAAVSKTYTMDFGQENPVDPIIREVWRAAQLSALESVAKEMCEHCKYRGKPQQDQPPLHTGLKWWHPPTPTWGFTECEAGLIWARLRSEAGSGSEPGK